MIFQASPLLENFSAIPFVVEWIEGGLYVEMKSRRLECLPLY